MEEQIPMPAVTHKVSWSPATMRDVIRSPLKVHGGKHYLSASILAVCRSAMVECGAWFEDCAGGANWSLQSEPLPGTVQIINEIDPLVYNVWRCFANAELYAALLRRLQEVNVVCRETMEVEWMRANAVCRALYGGASRGAWLILNDLGAEERAAAAAAVIVNRRMSRGGMGKNFAWQDRERGGQPGEINSWKTFVANHAPRVRERMGNIEPICRDSFSILATMAEAEAGYGRAAPPFYYIDPPYLPKTRTAKQVYDYEWTTEMHETFLALVRHRKSPIAISGYENPLYAEALSHWTLHRFAIVNHSGQGEEKQDRIETLYTNW